MIETFSDCGIPSKVHACERLYFLQQGYTEALSSILEFESRLQSCERRVATVKQIKRGNQLTFSTTNLLLLYCESLASYL